LAVDSSASPPRIESVLFKPRVQQVLLTTSLLLVPLGWWQAAGFRERLPREPALPVLRLDLNHATAADLAMLPGIGPQLAARIVADRTAHGPFLAINDLTRVRGIGRTKLATVRKYLIVDRSSAFGIAPPDREVVLRPPAGS
jgi:competence ComEA-like helix-hairpin-helix protein